MDWRTIQAGLDWVKEYNGPLTVLIALGGVPVAVWYAILTRRLANLAATSANAAADQAKTTRKMFEAAHRPYLEILADWRPIPKDEETVNIEFTFGFQNHGAIPARIVDWNVEIARWEPDFHENLQPGEGEIEVTMKEPVKIRTLYAITMEAGRKHVGEDGGEFATMDLVVFPGTPGLMAPNLTDVAFGEKRTGSVRVDARVEYVGLGRRRYRTRLLKILTYDPKSSTYQQIYAETT